MVEQVMSFDPFIRDASGEPIGTAIPPKGAFVGGGGGGSPTPPTISGGVTELEVPTTVTGLTQAEKEALVKREQVKFLAQQRGRSLTRLETERAVGGGRGVRALRRGTRKLRRAGLEREDVLVEKQTQTLAPTFIAGQRGEVREPARFQRFAGRISETDEIGFMQRELERSTSFRELARQQNLPAIVRKSARETGGLVVDVTATRIGLTPSREQRIRTGEFVGETALLTGLGFTTQSTAQIMRAIQPTGVAFAGVQKTIGKTLQTDVAFATTRGEKGLARGISRVVAIEGDKSVVKTIAGGGTFKRGVVFPTGKMKIDVTGTFKGADITLGRTGTLKGKPATVQASIGKVDSKIFVGGSVGVGEGVTGVLGRTRIKGGADVISAGLLKKSGPEFSNIMSGTSATATKGISRTAFVGVQDIVKSAVVQTPKTPTRFIPAVTTRTITPTLKAEQEIKQIQQPVTIQAVSQREIQKVSQITVQLTKLTTRQRVGQKTGQIIGIKQEAITTQRLVQPLQLKKVQQPKQRVIPAFAKFPTVPTRPPIIPSTLPKILAPRPIGREATFRAEVRGTRGFFPVGRGLTLGKAVSVGALITRRTAPTTFRVRAETGGRARGGFQLPKGFKQRRGLVFVEQPLLKIPLRIKI